MDPGIRSIDRLASDIGRLGAATPDTKGTIDRDESTFFTEALVTAVDDPTANALIPLHYEQRGAGLYDEFGNDLVALTAAGRDFAKAEAEKPDAKPGAYKEYLRRCSETNNIEAARDMAPGTAQVEVSDTPWHWGADEIKGQSYGQLCQVRIMYKQLDGSFSQFIIVARSNQHFAAELQKQFGVPEAELKTDADDLLANPRIFSFSGRAAELAQNINRNVMVARINSQDESAVGGMTLAGLQRARNMWTFVREQEQLRAEHLSTLTELSTQDRLVWQEGISSQRYGVIAKLMNRYHDDISEASVASKGAGYLPPEIHERSVRALAFLSNESSTAESAKQAAARGLVFLACNQEVKLGAGFSSSIDSTTYDLQASGRELEGRRVGRRGKCGAGCGNNGELYGCGLCKSCNDDWCRSAKNGVQLSNDQLKANRKKSKGKTAQGWLGKATKQVSTVSKG